MRFLKQQPEEFENAIVESIPKGIIEGTVTENLDEISHKLPDIFPKDSYEISERNTLRSCRKDQQISESEGPF